MLRATATALLLLCASLSIATPADDLRQAWTEYSFHSFDIAGRLFARVLEESTDPAEQQQARIGRAMIAQFNTKRPDPGTAIGMYREILETGISGEAEMLVTSFLAECYANTARREEANRLWQSLIESRPDSIVAQDSLIARTLANMDAWQGEETAAAMSALAEGRARLPTPVRERPGLAPAMERLVASWHYWGGRYREARDALIRFCDLATKRTTSYGWFAGSLLRTARISEELLDDRETAGRYYRRAILETPNHYQSFYGLRRAVALGAITRQEVRDLNLHGITEKVMDELDWPQNTETD